MMIPLVDRHSAVYIYTCGVCAFASVVKSPQPGVRMAPGTPPSSPLGTQTGHAARHACACRYTLCFCTIQEVRFFLQHGTMSTLWEHRNSIGFLYDFLCPRCYFLVDFGELAWLNPFCFLIFYI